MFVFASVWMARAALNFVLAKLFTTGSESFPQTQSIFDTSKIQKPDDEPSGCGKNTTTNTQAAHEQRCKGGKKTRKLLCN